ncbi:hypothetical protein LguiB_011841 [Lonicera macranthoides]
MESWVPLLDTFLNSTCPETEASLWLQQSFNPSSNTTTTNSFLSFLAKPTDVIVLDSSSSSYPLPPTNTKRVMWIQTLPNAVQARILSFLASDHRRFCLHKLSNLARAVLSDGQEVEFWVKRAARQLLDRVSDSNYEWVSCFNLDSEEERVNNDFGSLPEWLKDAANTDDLLLPWLPISTDELNVRMPFSAYGDDEDLEVVVEKEEEEKEDNLNRSGMEVDIVRPKNDPIEPKIVEKVACLKTRILNFESTSKTVELSNEIRQICVGEGVDSLAILGLIEPWKVDDETASILISNLSDGNEEELGWPSHVLCSIILPKLLLLKESASRVLLTATIEYCKLHQRAAVYALVFPLILLIEGINNPISDVMIRIMKECLHPAHVSAFCQKLLCGEEDDRKFICLPFHRCLISNQLVWTESVFNLFYNILNHNVHFTQDSVDQLVYKVNESVGGFSKSLKFGNFLLCLVNKCGPLLKCHKVALIEAVEQTNTLVTRSILSKLATLDICHGDFDLELWHQGEKASLYSAIKSLALETIDKGDLPLSCKVGSFLAFHRSQPARSDHF